MAKLVGYMTAATTTKNGIDRGFLAKAMCSFCGRKYGSLEEANKCEKSHIEVMLCQELNNNIFPKDILRKD